jgi:hypothetical protein
LVLVVVVVVAVVVEEEPPPPPPELELERTAKTYFVPPSTAVGVTV